jgi:hypothetical protein
MQRYLRAYLSPAADVPSAREEASSTRRGPLTLSDHLHNLCLLLGQQL